MPSVKATRCMSSRTLQAAYPRKLTTWRLGARVHACGRREDPHRARRCKRGRIRLGNATPGYQAVRPTRRANANAAPDDASRCDAPIRRTVLQAAVGLGTLG